MRLDQEVVLKKHLELCLGKYTRKIETSLKSCYLKVNEAFRNRKSCRLTCIDYQKKTREKYVRSSCKESASSRLRNWKTQ